MSVHGRSARWPDIPYELWNETSEALHQWLQIVGKYRLALTPWANHSWHATFYLHARGLDTSVMHFGDRSVQVLFDFIDHRLVCAVSDGERRTLPLEPMSVARRSRSCSLSWTARCRARSTRDVSS